MFGWGPRRNVTACVWQSEDNFRKLVLSFSWVVLDQTRELGLGLPFMPSCYPRTLIYITCLTLSPHDSMQALVLESRASSLFSVLCLCELGSAVTIFHVVFTIPSHPVCPFHRFTLSGLCLLCQVQATRPGASPCSPGVFISFFVDRNNF